MTLWVPGLVCVVRLGMTEGGKEGSSISHTNRLEMIAGGGFVIGGHTEGFEAGVSNLHGVGTE